MSQFLPIIKQLWDHRPYFWYDDSLFGAETIPLPANATILVLAPHPDDPESVAVTMRLCMLNGCDVRYVIVTLSPSGVQNDYIHLSQDPEGGSDRMKKKAIRQREQIQAASLFGLPRDKVWFLDLEDAAKTDPSMPETYQHDMGRVLEYLSPDIAVMPSGNDTNRTHKAVYNGFRAAARDWVNKTGASILAMYNEDPKTTHIRRDLFVLFGEQRADWKRELLKAHNSQQQRNLRLRKIGFDDRILNVNRLSARNHADCSGIYQNQNLYAEVYELELFGDLMEGAI